MALFARLLPDPIVFDTDAIASMVAKLSVAKLSFASLV